MLILEIALGVALGGILLAFLPYILIGAALLAGLALWGAVALSLVSEGYEWAALIWLFGSIIWLNYIVGNFDGFGAWCRATILGQALRSPPTWLTDALSWLSQGLAHVVAPAVRWLIFWVFMTFFMLSATGSALLGAWFVIRAAGMPSIGGVIFGLWFGAVFIASGVLFGRWVVREVSARPDPQLYSRKTAVAETERLTSELQRIRQPRESEQAPSG
jgi:hypothetical protein